MVWFSASAEEPFMSEDSGFQFTDDAVPRAYDEVMVARLFEPWALLLLDQTDLDRDAVVLDVATGPGTVARLAATRIGPAGRVVAADISRPMLNVANSKPSLPGAAPITYIESPAAPLAVESAAFDVALCQQGLQFFPDRCAALREMRRALKPRGQLVVAVWCHIEDNAIYKALHAALCDSIPGDVADRLLAPFSWPDGQALKDAIEAAGFREIHVRREKLPLIFEDGVTQAARALSATPLAPSLASLSAAKGAELNVAIGARLAPLLREGTVRGDMTSNIAVARA
jgi:ubiquinone/menaquinone biosynthesis C-methylase UbiE